jgi:hypothetical protein
MKGLMKATIDFQNKKKGKTVSVFKKFFLRDFSFAKNHF